MTLILWEIAIIFVLLSINGLLAMTEIAVVSSRKTRLQQLAAKGDLKAAAALKLADEPNRFLAAVQIGITLVGVLAGAFGGATIAEQLAGFFNAMPWLAKWSEAISVAIVVSAITFCSLIFGELVPKRIGMTYPETIARLVAGPMQCLSRIASPVISLLAATATAVLKILRIRLDADTSVSEDDVRLLVRQGSQSGALLAEETSMVEAVLSLDQLRVRELMTPRNRIVWLDAAKPSDELCRQMIESGHTYFPVHECRRSNVLGVVALTDVFAALCRGEPLDFKCLAKAPLLVPPTQPAIRLLERFRSQGATFALVPDEFGSICGLITAQDLLEAISGDFRDGTENEIAVVMRADGSWLIDAAIYLQDLEYHFPDFPIAPAHQRPYVTLNGLILEKLGHIPQTGELLEVGNYSIEIVDLDGLCIDKILMRRSNVLGI